MPHRHLLPNPHKSIAHWLVDFSGPPCTTVHPVTAASSVARVSSSATNHIPKVPIGCLEVNEWDNGGILESISDLWIWVSASDERQHTAQPIRVTKPNSSFMEYRLSNYPACFITHIAYSCPCLSKHRGCSTRSSNWGLIFVCEEMLTEGTIFYRRWEFWDWQSCIRVSYKWNRREIIALSPPSHPPLQNRRKNTLSPRLSHPPLRKQDSFFFLACPSPFIFLSSRAEQTVYAIRNGLRERWMTVIWFIRLAEINARL